MSTKKAWFGLDSRQEVTAHIARHPGRIADMIDQRFMVKLEWLDKGVRCTNGEQELDVWPVGTQGVVCSLKFCSTRGWTVEVEHEKGLVDLEQYLVEIPISDFLRCTEPFNHVIPKYLRKEAANDSDIS